MLLMLFLLAYVIVNLNPNFLCSSFDCAVDNLAVTMLFFEFVLSY